MENEFQIDGYVYSASGVKLTGSISDNSALWICAELTMSL